MKSKFTLWSVVLLLAGFIFVGCDNERTENASDFHFVYLQLIIPQYFISNKSGIWSLSLIVHSKG